MKYIAIFLSIMMVVTAGCAVMSGVSDPRRSEPAGEPFEGTAQGYRGPITVQVWIDKGAITGIVVTGSREDRFVGRAAIEELVEVVIENNSTDVDTVSGATISSKGFLEAVNNARQLAGN